ncbi:RING-H2 finger protein ATL20-like [Gastrolobium bilobum]|uniref:RING-H2 finger protein ATL20-like n=1 Tax=Gastrolobium bilobum TaxID=150636 RepID=UPI002AB2E8A9|nr:RING-H2 finger protein ATL20-like [Gastrolobium bilobum]
MATLSISFLFSMVLLLPHSTRSTTPVCDKRYCGSPDRELPIEFPFQLIEGNNQSNRCGYPGFDVLCNDRKQKLLKLSQEIGEFVVNYISLEKQRIWINDPDACLPRRLMQNMNLNDSPFRWDKDSYDNFEKLTILNCTKLAAKLIVEGILYPIPCLSNNNHSITYALNSSLDSWKSSCNEIGFALVPVKDHSKDSSIIEEGLYSDIMLQWNTPLCECEADQRCGFLTDTGLTVTCYNFTSPGGSPPISRPGPRRVIFFLVWGITGFLFFFYWIVLSVFRRRRHSQQRWTNIESNIREPPGVVVVLDGSRIEQYPKFQLNESGQFNDSSIDKVCSICLGEYQPMETLRSMPQCNHYFHVHCIDAWLKMNATCPLCRNEPEGSVLVTSSLPPSTYSFT